MGGQVFVARGRHVRCHHAAHVAQVVFYEVIILEGALGGDPAAAPLGMIEQPRAMVDTHSSTLQGAFSSVWVLARMTLVGSRF